MATRASDAGDDDETGGEREDDDVAYYDAVAGYLNQFDRIDARVETDRTFSPNLYVTAREGYGAPTTALQKLAGQFDPDELATAPTTTRAGDRAIVFRAKVGGFAR